MVGIEGGQVQIQRSPELVANFRSLSPSIFNINLQTQTASDANNQNNLGSPTDIYVSIQSRRGQENESQPLRERIKRIKAQRRKQKMEKLLKQTLFQRRVFNPKVTAPMKYEDPQKQAEKTDLEIGLQA